MIIILTGASGTGKDSVARILQEKYGYKTAISFTTRQPREGEINGVNYYFVSVDKFKEMQNLGEFIETDKYSGERYYGSRECDYPYNCDCVKILTPNGVKQIKNNCNKVNCKRDDYYIVYLYSSLAVKCKRYIEREKRCFDTNKLMELMRRSIADEEMFRGFEEIADLCIENNEDIKIEEIADLIVKVIEDL